MTREEIIQEIGFSTEELKALLLLEKVMPTDAHGLHRELTAAEKKQVISFLEKSIGNIELNKKLLELGKFEQQDTGIGFAVINMLRNVTFKSRHRHEIHLDEYDKLTLQQFAILSDLASLERDLAVLERFDLIAGASPLSQLYNDVIKAKHMLDSSLEERFSKDLKNPFGMRAFEINATKGAPIISHTQQKNEFILADFLYSEDYKIKLDKLIDCEETKEFLKNHLGKDWLTQLENKFSLLQREIHDAQLIGPIHYQIINQAPSAKESFCAEDTGSMKIICSPFVALSVFKAIKELNDQIVQELKDKGVEEIPSSLLQLPFKEKAEVLSPSQFIDVMDKCAALERLSGQATITMRARLSDNKNEGEEGPPMNRPK